MTRRGSWIAAASVVVALAGAIASCGSTSRPPEGGEPYEGGGIVVVDGSAADGEGMKTGDGGSPATDGAGHGDGQPTEAALGGDGEGGESGPDGPPLVQPQCDDGAWTTTTPVSSIPGAGFDRFGAVSAAGTTVAWTQTGGALFVADRASTSAAFGTPIAVDTSSSPVADDRVAMTPDGLELVATRSDRTSFTSFVRATVGGSWGPSKLTDEFKYVAATIKESGGGFSEPVISADGLSLFYVLVIGTNLPVLYESPWDDGLKAWDVGVALPNPEFMAKDASSVRRPTGASSDRRTLFFFDEAAGIERAAWRNSPTSPFFFFDDVPIAPEASPTASCATLFFQTGEADAGGPPGVGTAQ